MEDPPMDEGVPGSVWCWILYAVLLAARVAMALAPGYIHPDEFFQSTEVRLC